jgi:hypothetical protein
VVGESKRIFKTGGTPEHRNTAKEELCIGKRTPNMRIGEEADGQLCFV